MSHGIEVYEALAIQSQSALPECQGPSLFDVLGQLPMCRRLNHA